MRNYFKKESLLNFYFIGFTLCLLYKFLGSLFDDSKKEYWGITEWLINYQGGFVRRGLRGEIVYQLNHYFDLDPYTVITIITTIAFLLLVTFLVRGFLQRGYPIFILPFVIFLGNPILNNYWMRADSMILLIFISVIYLVITKPRLYLVWVNILSILGLLIHELFIFITVPVLFLLLVRVFTDKQVKLFKSLVFSCLVLLPTLFASFLVTYFKGTSGTAFLIWDSWKGVSFPDSALVEMSQMNMGAIAGIGLSIQGGLKIPAEFVRCYDSGLYGPLVLLVTIVAIYFVVSNIDRLKIRILGQTPKVFENKGLFLNILFFQFCATAPLYVIGDDFSRWIYFWICSSFILMLLIPKDKANLIFPSKLNIVTLKIDNVFLNLFGNSQALIIALILVIGFPLYSWNLDGSIATSSLYVVLSSASDIIKTLMGFH